MIHGFQKKILEYWREYKTFFLIIVPILLLFVPKVFTGLELGDGLPRIAEAVKISKNPGFLLYPLPPIWYYITAFIWILTQSIRIAGLVTLC